MANTTNFNWETPDDTDLVKDGAAAIRTLGSAIDTSLVDLKGGTTGQVLSKATNTDMDFTWVAQDDSNAIQNAIIDAKGDLIVGTAADTPARLAVGTNGYILTADSAETAGMKWAAAASGGGMTLLSTTTLSGASTTISTISGSYNNLQLIIYGANVSSAGGVIVVRPNAVTNLSTGVLQENNNGSYGTGVFSSSGIECGYNAGMANSDTNNIISLVFYNYASSTNYKSFVAQYAYAKQTSGIFTGQLGGAFRSNTAISSIEIVASGTFSAGTALLYGVK
jgi:hypothetical protein